MECFLQRQQYVGLPHKTNPPIHKPRHVTIVAHVCTGIAWLSHNKMVSVMSQYAAFHARRHHVVLLCLVTTFFELHTTRVGGRTEFPGETRVLRLGD